VLEGKITSSGKMRIGDEEFDKPNTNDILGYNSGPFTTGPNQTRNAIIPRLAAAFHCTALLNCENYPSELHTFFQQDPINHYARLVHMHNVDRKGYAFAYDDVQPKGSKDQSGKVNAGDPILFTVSARGQSASKGRGNKALQEASAGGYKREALLLPPEQQQSGAGGYDRPLPPLLAEKEGGGWRSKAKGFAGKFMK
jgi:hypothetical protein